MCVSLSWEGEEEGGGGPPRTYPATFENIHIKHVTACTYPDLVGKPVPGNIKKVMDLSYFPCDRATKNVYPY